MGESRRHQDRKHQAAKREMRLLLVMYKGVQQPPELSSLE
jgi:hypothetical protein